MKPYAENSSEGYIGLFLLFPMKVVLAIFSPRQTWPGQIYCYLQCRLSVFTCHASWVTLGSHAKPRTNLDLACFSKTSNARNTNKLPNNLCTCWADGYVSVVHSNFLGQHSPFPVHNGTIKTPPTSVEQITFADIGSYFTIKCWFELSCQQCIRGT